MESLPSSGSKALFDGLASSSSPRLVSAFHFSDRLEFSFCNDKVGNFRFLHMVQNKGVSPVHAVPYESQVDLETEEPQAQDTDCAEQTKFVRIKFQLQKDCKFGEQFLIVGDHPMIGAWDPLNALPMTWSEGHQWSVETDVPAEKSIRYKFILKSVSGNIIWQPGPDRIVKTWETVNVITVCESWENAGLQKIVEEEQLDNSNGKPLIDSEMSNLSENLDLPEEDTSSDATNDLDSEDSKTHLEEKPLAQPDVQQIVGGISSSSSVEKPMPMVAEDIDSSEDAPKSTPGRRGVNDMALQSAVTVHDLEQTWKGSEVHDQGKEVVKGNLIEFEGSPALVPGLTPPETEETTVDKVEERITMDNSVEAVDETENQNMPEVQFNKEQEESEDGVRVNKEEQGESEDGKTQEKAETLIDEAELVDNEFQEKFHSTTAMVESEDGKAQVKAETLVDETELVDNEFQEKFHSTTAIVKSEDGKAQEKAETLIDEPELVDNEFQENVNSTTAIVKVSGAHENLFESDIQWGHGILKMVLSKLGLLGKILQ